MLDGVEAFTLGEIAAGDLIMIFSAVAGEVGKLVENGTRLVEIAFLPIDAGTQQLYLIGIVSGLLGPFIGFKGFVKRAARDQRPAQIEIGQRSFGLAQMLNRLLYVAKKERGDAELEMPAFGGGPGGRLDFLFDDFRHVAKGAILSTALGQPLAQLRHRSRITILALDQ